VTEADERWELNYFNYFTEVEEHFQKARGTGLFLLSPVDWALIETWKNAGIPLTAVLRGIDAAFEKWHARKRKYRTVNALAYCTQEVIAEAQTMAGVVESGPSKAAAPPFSKEDLQSHLEQAARALRERGGDYAGLAASIERILDDLDSHYQGLEELEQRLTVLEQKMVATVQASAGEEELFEARREMERHIRPYRGKMTAEQLAMLEKQYLERVLLDRASLPRLSLFYLR